MFGKRIGFISGDFVELGLLVRQLFQALLPFRTKRLRLFVDLVSIVHQDDCRRTVADCVFNLGAEMSVFGVGASLEHTFSIRLLGLLPDDQDDFSFDIDLRIVIVVVLRRRDPKAGKQKRRIEFSRASNGERPKINIEFQSERGGGSVAGIGLKRERVFFGGTQFDATR